MSIIFFYLLKKYIERSPRRTASLPISFSISIWHGQRRGTFGCAEHRAHSTVLWIACRWSWRLLQHFPFGLLTEFNNQTIYRQSISNFDPRNLSNLIIFPFHNEDITSTLKNHIEAQPGHRTNNKQTFKLANRKLLLENSKSNRSTKSIRSWRARRKVCVCVICSFKLGAWCDAGQELG